jgi:hypothetical protein
MSLHARTTATVLYYDDTNGVQFGLYSVFLRFGYQFRTTTRLQCLLVSSEKVRERAFFFPIQLWIPGDTSDCTCTTITST